MSATGGERAGLAAGKLPLDLLERHVLRYRGAQRAELLRGGATGEDAAVLDLGGDLVVASTDPITAAEADAGWLAVHVSANDVAAAGAEPVLVLLTLLLPEGSGPALVERLMAGAQRAAEEVGLAIGGGHTEVTPGLPRPILSATVLGRRPRERDVHAGALEPGDALVMAGAAGTEGAAILAADRAGEVRAALGEEAWRRLLDLRRRISIVPAARIALATGSRAMHDVTEGGVWGAAYEMAAASGVGLELDPQAVPVPPDVERLCRHFGLDVYRLISSGSLLIGLAWEEAGPLVDRLREAGIPAARIGRVRERAAGLRIRQGEGWADLEPPRGDELWRVVGGSSGGG
ncbi:MAG: AIR synthase-related protein [Bacillota bacterium]|nr:AIR synthase-related protein [Bacillota bacterium]